MQIPKPITSVPVCLALARYAGQRLERLAGDARADAWVAHLEAACSALEEAQRDFEEMLRESLHARVDLVFEHGLAEFAVCRTQHRADRDRRHGGPRRLSEAAREVAARAKDSRMISMVQGLRTLEAELEEARHVWPHAEAEKAAVAARREGYEAALEAREAREQELTRLRARRDEAKLALLRVFTEAATLLQPSDGTKPPARPAGAARRLVM